VGLGSVKREKIDLLLFFFLWLGHFSYLFGIGLLSTIFALADNALLLEATHSFLFLSLMMM